MLLPELMNRLSDDACALTRDILHRFDSLEPMEQNRAVATHCKKIKKSDGLVDFSSASNFYDKYRAFEGWPGIFVEGGMKIKEVSLVETDSQNEKGKILELKDESIVVACTKGTLEIGILQPASKKAVNAKAYCVGRGLKVGNSLL
jgi:methionyl-tRNA formyltransferase